MHVFLKFNIDFKLSLLQTACEKEHVHVHILSLSIGVCLHEKTWSVKKETKRNSNYVEYLYCANPIQISVLICTVHQAHTHTDMHDSMRHRIENNQTTTQKYDNIGGYGTETTDICPRGRGKCLYNLCCFGGWLDCFKADVECPIHQ